MLKQETWGDDSRSKPIKMENATRLSWEIKGLEKVPDDMNQPKYPYLYVDDVKCDGLSFTAVSGGASETPKSSSSAAVGQSSSSVVAGSSSSAKATSSSSAIVPGSSATVTYETVVDIDDVEDLDEVLKTKGTWYAYTDKEPGGKSTISNVYDQKLGGYVVAFPGTEDPTNGTKGYVGLKDINWDQGTYTEAPFVALGLNTNADTSKGIDLSKCGAISYRYKGSAHTFKVQDGSVTDYAYHEYPLDDSQVWKTMVINVEDIAQPNWTQDPKDLNWGAIKKMAWEVVGYEGFD